MTVAVIEPFDRWFLSLSKGSGTTCRNDHCTKYGGFDKLNHRKLNFLDSPEKEIFMVMFFVLMGFIGLWAVTEIVETILQEKRNHRPVKHLKWID